MIAIVDDDDAMREALGELLQVAGLTGVAFEGATEFLSGEAKQRFDAVITDIRMPHVDGIELIRRVRQRGSESPILVLTSCCEPEMRSRAFAAGATDYLTKPVADSDLIRRIEAILGLNGRALAPSQ
ncbi:MAG TPA: response regulator [Nitrospiraceae bacterium]|nr:response regulator [Nitrospiraceae bacterium]